MDGKRLGYSGGPQETPGTVLIGLEWPLKIKDIMRQMSVVSDLILVKIATNSPYSLFGSGLVKVTDLKNLRIMTHEVCHAHQQWLFAPQGKNGGVGESWDGTPEGRAYAVARQADWDEVGRTVYDSWAAGRVRESAAETCARWWDLGDAPAFRRPWLKENAPNRARWAGNWLTKR